MASHLRLIETGLELRGELSRLQAQLWAFDLWAGCWPSYWRQKIPGWHPTDCCLMEGEPISRAHGSFCFACEMFVEGARLAIVGSGNMIVVVAAALAVA